MSSVAKKTHRTHSSVPFQKKTKERDECLRRKTQKKLVNALSEKRKSVTNVFCGKKCFSAPKRKKYNSRFPFLQKDKKAVVFPFQNREAAGVFLPG